MPYWRIIVFTEEKRMYLATLAISQCNLQKNLGLIYLKDNNIGDPIGPVRIF